MDRLLGGFATAISAAELHWGGTGAGVGGLVGPLAGGAAVGGTVTLSLLTLASKTSIKLKI